MPTFGRISEFVVEEERISAYLERVELYFGANDIANEKKVAILLSVIGAKTYAVLRSLVAPDQPKDKSFAELKALLKAHYDPKPLVIAERFRFYRRDQTAEESISEFLVELRRLAAHCEFGQFLDEALRDRLVCGLRNDAIQKRLLSEADVTLAKAVQIASSMESAEKQSLQLNVTKPGAICQVRVSCNRCNSTDHSVRECRIKDSVVCFRCKKKGHIVRACREKGRQPWQWVETKERQKQVP